MLHLQVSARILQDFICLTKRARGSLSPPSLILLYGKAVARARRARLCNSLIICHAASARMTQIQENIRARLSGWRSLTRLKISSAHLANLGHARAHDNQDLVNRPVFFSCMYKCRIPCRLKDRNAFHVVVTIAQLFN